MTERSYSLDRRTALQTVAGAAALGLSGCLSENEPGPSSTPSGTDTTDGTGDGPFQHVGVEGTTLVVELAADSEVDQVNLIQPNGELWGTREVAAGAEQVSFEFRAAYSPGEYDVLGVNEEETVAEESLEIRPNLEIKQVGLYRNHPDKPWEEVYGEDADLLINGEAFVTVENTGTGPETINELTFTGDVPNPLEDPRGSGIYETEQVVVPAGAERDLFSGSLPFGAETPSGMGCSTDGNSGQFTVTLMTAVRTPSVTQTYDVQYSGSSDMTDCEVTITEA